MKHPSFKLLFEDLYYCIELLWWHSQFPFLPGKRKEREKKNMNSKQTSESNDLSCFEMYYRNINLGKYVWLNSGMLPGAEASRLVQSLTVWSAWGLGAPGSSFYAGQGQNWYPRSGFTWTLISWCFSGVPEVLRSCTGTGTCYC